jgi:hypothetical protein|tara:strand:- start:3380 stop:3682 length:303 start_codon:yes stop_codon:yes gene_type:complete
MITHLMEQRSDAWLAIRVGKLTASAADKMLARTKNGPSVQRHDLRMQLACEALTGISCDTPFVLSAAVNRGVDCEPAAILAYEALSGLVVYRVGFLEAQA